MTFRSREMMHYRLIVPRESAYSVAERLVSLELSHQVDLGCVLMRSFASQVKRIDDALLKIDTMVSSLKEAASEPEIYDQTQNYVKALENMWVSRARSAAIDRSKLIDQIEAQVNQNWGNFIEMKGKVDRLHQNRKACLEKIACKQALSFCVGKGDRLKGVATIVGVVAPQLQFKLAMAVYRISRGYACYKLYDDYQFQGLKQFAYKTIVLMYPVSEILDRKLGRVMEILCSYCYKENSRQIVVEDAEYNQVSNLMQLSDNQMKNVLDKIKSVSCIEQWRIFLWRQKLLYSCLNQMQLREHFLIAQLYVPKDRSDELCRSLSQEKPAPSLQQLPNTKPPTAFTPNIYTAVAQQITNTYGIPRYEEINPSVFTAITFPFFFGVMFGDIGHGLVLFTVGLFLVFKNDFVKSSSLSFLSQLRYLIVMMGFFSFYCGFIYNDFIGLHLNLFGSCYSNIPEALNDEEMKNSLQRPFPKDEDCVYPFGIDPVWGRGVNELVFVNGLKMKIAVIIAILHMTVGVVIKAFNAKHFKRNLDFYLQFIPQFLFLFLLFGYMDFLIVFKWLKDWKTANGLPPSIISTMMDIGLKIGKTAVNGNMWGESGNTSQDTIQLIILLVAVICVPTMLLPKPLIEISRHNKKKHVLSGSLLQKDEMEEEEKQQIIQVQHDSSEIFVHQLIETIEFVLGAVSNTASYLRLWALSLAHSQLAKVFFEKSLLMAYEMDSGIGFIAVPLMFYALCWITFGVLMCMDTMECFLHSLRLHWVEFQNKFYKGDGYIFQPLSLSNYVKQMKQK